jgi:hypothetical protein
MSTAFALEARRPVVVPGREIDWRLFPSGAKRNEGTAIALPSRSEVLCPTSLAWPLERMNPLSWPRPNHTQAGKTPRRMSPHEGTKDTRPRRRAAEILLCVPFIYMGAGTRTVIIPLSRRWSLYIGMRQIHQDAGGVFTER